MTYEFIDMYTRQSTTDTVSSDAVFLIGLNKLIEDIAPDFKTLYVDGRGVASKKIESAETSKNGAQYLSDKINTKEMTLTGFFSCSSNRVLNKQLIDLNNALNEGEMKFSFNDQRDYWMKGVFEVSKVEQGTLSPTVEIKIHCYDPVLYSSDFIHLNFGTALSEDLGMKQYFNQGWRPEKVHFEYAQNSDVTSKGVTITVQSKDKQRNGRTLRTIPYQEVNSSQSYAEFLLNEEGGRLGINGYYADKYINIESDLAGFVLGIGDSIQCSNQITNGYAEFRRKEVG